MPMKPYFIMQVIIGCPSCSAYSTDRFTPVYLGFLFCGYR